MRFNFNLYFYSKGVITLSGSNYVWKIVFMRTLYCFIIFSLLSIAVSAQHNVRLSEKASLGVNPNIETYFIVEKLAVEHIGNFVFNIKGTDYSHQPIVDFGFKRFKIYQNDSTVLRMAQIMRTVRDSVHDNGPILDYLVNQEQFPAKKSRFVKTQTKHITSLQQAGNQSLLNELRDSLANFYVKAKVSYFLNDNRTFYKGAVNEVVKDLERSSFKAMENWYGKTFPAYELYISPAMPIPPGEDNYRGFGPIIKSPQGKIPSMIVSSSRMLKVKDSLSLYHAYGFNNPDVNKFIAIHEISHSFINPVLEKYVEQINADSALFTKDLRAKLSPFGINDWYVCIVEHLVRLGEIRIAVSTKNYNEAARLRKLHIGEYKCVLLPLLEAQILNYERNRNHYQNFEMFLPELLRVLHEIKPSDIQSLLLQNQN